jgi:hypothetical protein
MTSTLPLGTLDVVTFLFNEIKTLLQQGFLVVKLKSSLNKNVTTARVTSGKVEGIIKQKRYISKGS